MCPQVLDDLGFLEFASRDYRVTLHAHENAHMPRVIGIQIIVQDALVIARGRSAR